MLRLFILESSYQKKKCLLQHRAQAQRHYAPTTKSQHLKPVAAAKMSPKLVVRSRQHTTVLPSVRRVTGQTTNSCARPCRPKGLLPCWLCPPGDLLHLPRKSFPQTYRQDRKERRQDVYSRGKIRKGCSGPSGVSDILMSFFPTCSRMSRTNRPFLFIWLATMPWLGCMTLSNTSWQVSDRISIYIYSMIFRKQNADRS